MSLRVVMAIFPLNDIFLGHSVESCFKAIEAVYKLTGMSMVLMLLLKVQEKARSVLGLATIRHEISSVCCLLASNTVLVPGRHTGLSEHRGG